MVRWPSTSGSSPLGADSPVLRSNLGAAYAGLGRYEDAVLQYGRALATDGANVAIRRNLALAFRQGRAPDGGRRRGGEGPRRAAGKRGGGAPPRRLPLPTRPERPRDRDPAAAGGPRLAGARGLVPARHGASRRGPPRRGAGRDRSRAPRRLGRGPRLSRDDVREERGLRPGHAGDPQGARRERHGAAGQLPERPVPDGREAERLPGGDGGVPGRARHRSQPLRVEPLPRQPAARGAAARGALVPRARGAAAARGRVGAVLLGAVYVSLGRTEEALPLLERVAVAAPDHLQTQMQLAIVYFRLGRTADSARAREAVGRNPRTASLYLSGVSARSGGCWGRRPPRRAGPKWEPD